jgi:hypothetical protein
MRKQVRERILLRDGSQCAYCGSTNNLQIDHIIPICRGGKENENNMQVLCRTCNLKKGKSINLEPYFIKSDSPDYIYIKRDFPLSSITPKELQHVLFSKFNKDYNLF